MNRCSWLLLLMLVACGKKEDPLPQEELNGLMLEAVSQQPVAFYPVHLTCYRWVITAEKDAEYPNGRPVLQTSKFQTETDADGRYHFRFPVYSNTGFTVAVPKTIYCLVSPSIGGVALYDDMRPMQQYLRTLYDTLLVERSGIIRYQILHNTGFENEQLYLKTASGSPFLRPDSGPRRFAAYNVLLFGRTNQVIYDTVAAETQTTVPVEWLHYLTDTLAYRKDAVPVRAGATTDYLLRY